MGVPARPPQIAELGKSSLLHSLGRGKYMSRNGQRLVGIRIRRSAVRGAEQQRIGRRMAKPRITRALACAGLCGIGWKTCIGGEGRGDCRKDAHRMQPDASFLVGPDCGEAGSAAGAVLRGALPPAFGAAWRLNCDGGGLYVDVTVHGLGEWTRSSEDCVRCQSCSGGRELGASGGVPTEEDRGRWTGCGCLSRRKSGAPISLISLNAAT